MDGAARGKRQPGGSDSDTRRRDERVRFADDTVVQTSDGRAVITDDAAVTAERHPARSRRSMSMSAGTLPARLRAAGQPGRQTLPELDHREAADVARVVHANTTIKPSQRVHARPLIFDDDNQRPAPSSSSTAARTVHRSNTASATKFRKSGTAQPTARRAVDANYHRDAATVRIHR